MHLEALDRPGLGLAECLRVVRHGGRVIVVKVDGASGAPDLAAFAASSRVPYGMRGAYVRFAMRTVVDVAPIASEMEAVFKEVTGEKVDVTCLESAPFLVAQATSGSQC